MNYKTGQVQKPATPSHPDRAEASPAGAQWICSPALPGLLPDSHAMNHPDLARFAWISIAAAVATILLKGLAWWLTGSVGLL
ncbi:MAG: transporter, partial [Proteobacteria bacterium]|nr:transporter [Pseudomonadota bacterium]